MIAVLVAFWKRPEVTEVVMRHYRRMADARKDLVLVSVGSEGPSSRALAESNGWDYVEAPNSPLSDKLSAGLARCREYDPSAGLLAMGSDDLVTEPWVDRCSRSQAMLGLRDMHLIRRRTWEGIHWTGYVGRREGESVGAHRFFPRALLDRLGWDLWPPGLECNLDGNLSRKLAILKRESLLESEVLSMADSSCSAVGISSDVNLTPWKLIIPNARPLAPAQILAAFPADTRAEIEKLRS